LGYYHLNFPRFIVFIIQSMFHILCHKLTRNLELENTTFHVKFLGEVSENLLNWHSQLTKFIYFKFDCHVPSEIYDIKVTEEFNLRHLLRIHLLHKHVSPSRLTSKSSSTCCNSSIGTCISFLNDFRCTQNPLGHISIKN
jgi:hypothetical protein